MATELLPRVPAAPATAPRRSPKARGPRPSRLQHAAMLTPATALITAFMLIPIVLAGYFSFTDWDGITRNPGTVGWANYTRLFHDPDVRHAAVVTLIITIVGTALCNAAGLGLALLLNAPTRRNGILRAVFFYPYVIGPIIIGFLWSAILGSNGAIDNLLSAGHHSPIPFLSDPDWAVASITAVVVWSQFGVNVVLYLAGLQTIPAALTDAARIDGANAWQTFKAVTWPMLASSVTINLVLVLVGLLRVYEVVLALTDGGPAGRTNTFAFLILSSSFRNNQLGYGAAQAMTLMIVIGALAIGVTALRRRAEEAVSS